MIVFKYILATLIILSLLGCPEDIDIDPTVKTGNIVGTVIDLDNSPLSGVTVETMGIVDFTDDEGIFVIEDAPVSEKLVIQFSKAGYATNYKVVPVVEDQSSPIKAALSLIGFENTVAAEADNEIEFQGAKVSISANSFKDKNGFAVTGGIDVKASYFDPTSEQYVNLFPGTFSGISISGDEGLLESYGFIDISFSQAGGKLDLAEGSTAQLSIPIPSQLQSNSPDSIPLFYFDEELGSWIEDGVAYQSSGKFVGSVSHFTNWNADEWYADEICILKGRVVDQDGNPLPLSAVYANGVDFNGAGFGHARIDGKFEMQIRSNSRVLLYAEYASLITGINLGISDIYDINPTCPPDGMNDIGDIVIFIDQDTTVVDPGDDKDKVWWDVFMRPFPGYNAIDAWKVGEGGRIEVCEACIVGFSEIFEARESNTNQTLLGIHFIDQQTGWICGNNGTILKTVNGGDNWDAVTLNTAGNDLYEVKFLGENFGCMVGTAGNIWYSHDAGQNWTKANTGIIQDLYDLDIISESTAWAVGKLGKILKTTDGGQNWFEQNSGTSLDLFGVSFINKYYGWATGLNGTLLYTEDGGNNWSPVNLNTGEDLLAIDFFQPNFGMITGTNGKILLTTDNGQTWKNEDVTGVGNLWAVDIYSSYGIIAGEEYSSFINLQQIPEPSSGWQSVTSGTDEDLYEVFFDNTAEGYSVGSNGTIIKSNDGGNSWSTLNSNTNEILWSIDKGSNILYACGGGETVIRSMDEGQNWQTMRQTGDDYIRYKKIQFINDAKGWTLSDESFLYTLDSASTWQEANGLPNISFNDFFSDFQFTSELEGFISGYLETGNVGFLYTTDDGGKNWTKLWEYASTSIYSPLLEIHYVNNNEAFLTSYQTLFKTEDGGNNWTLVNEFYSPSAMNFVDKYQGWGIGSAGVWSSPTVIFTNDGGSTWIGQGSESGALSDVTDMYMFDDSKGIVVGPSGQIYKTEKGGF